MSQVLSSGPRPSDRWIPWYFVLFFVVLAIVLGGMVYTSIHTMPGIVTEHSYEKGLAYNKAIDASVQQQALGWKSDVSVTETPSKDGVTVNFFLRDATGKPISNASSVKAWLIRPTHDGMDQEVALISQSKGHYVAALNLPMHGLWEVRIAAAANNQNYQMIKRVVLP